jgi:hypothetical protein
MIRVGIVSNPLSDGNRGHSRIAEFAAAQGEAVAFAAPSTVAALPAALADFAARGVCILGVDGGDGTVRDVLSALPTAFADAWPAIAILPSGKTNLIARDVGAFGAGAGGARRLLQAAKTPERMASCMRPCLEVSWGANTVRGMFAGAGAFTYATRMAGTWTFRRGFKQSLGVAITMMQVLRRCFGRRPGNLAAAMAFGDDAAVLAPPSSHLLFLATTLNRLMLGFWPFPGEREMPADVLHWLALGAPAHHLACTLWQAWRGRLGADEDHGVRGGDAHTLAARFAAPFVVDGEMFDPGGEIVTWRAGRPVRFVAARDTV